MTHDQNLVRRVIAEIFNSGRLEMANELFDAEFVNHGGLIPDLLRGPEAVKLSVSVLRRAFPDMRITIDALGIDEDVLVMDWTARNRRQGAVPGIDFGRSEHRQVTGSTRVRCASGMIAESWTEWDSSLLLRHLGIDALN